MPADEPATVIVRSRTAVPVAVEVPAVDPARERSRWAVAVPVQVPAVAPDSGRSRDMEPVAEDDPSEEPEASIALTVLSSRSRLTVHHPSRVEWRTVSGSWWARQKVDVMGVIDPRA